MINIQKQIDYWKIGAQEDLEVAQKLVQDEKIRHGLFFAHLALEKMLKAHVCRQIQDLAPKIHDLNLLSDMATFNLDQERTEFLKKMNTFQLAGRYPQLLPKLPSTDASKTLMIQVEEFYQWLLSQL